MLIKNTQPEFSKKSRKTAVNRGGRLFNGRNIITALSNSDSLASTIALEAAVTGGRGYNAYKRGGKDELRERFLDDIVSALFWMKGVDMFNALGDKFGGKVLKLPVLKFDTGEDALRTPLKNLAADSRVNAAGADAAKSMMKKLTAFKFAKIISASLLSTVLIGFIMPKINQKLTEMIINSRRLKKDINKETAAASPVQNSGARIKTIIEPLSFDEFILRTSKEKQQSFKGLAGIAHALENNTVCKMLTNDAGMITGRTLSARNKDEGFEYLFRDTASLFGYFASTPLIYAGLQKLSGEKDTTALDVKSARMLHNYLLEQLQLEDGSYKSMTAAEFEKEISGQLDAQSIKQIESLPFKKDVISLAELKEHITDENILKRAAAMAALQPEQAGRGAVLTKQQLQDVFKNGAAVSPEFMKKIYLERFGADLTNPLKYISMKKITGFRDNIDKYLRAVKAYADKYTGGIINAELLKKVNKRNYVLSAAFRLTGLSISALILGFAIPKLQYAITERRTGSKQAPGLRQYHSEKK